jgi:hypothetical protein
MTSLLRLRVGLLTPALGLLLAAGAQAQAPGPDHQTAQQTSSQQPPQQQLSAEQAQEAAEQQPPAEPPPGYLLGVEGAAVLEREGTVGDAIPGMPLLIGDRLRSEGGRLELKWAERSELQLSRYTDLDVLARGMVRVPRGRVVIRLVVAPGQSAHDQLAIDAPGASVRFFAAGEYHVTVGGSGAPEVELAVVRGSAQLASDRGMLMLAEGERSVVKDGGVPHAAGAYTARADDDAIEEEEADEDAPADRRDAPGGYDPTPDLEAFQRSSAGGAYGGTSYLPTELYGYETVLNQNGTWMSDPSYGYVWYPRVQSDWRPYYRGRWHHVPRYGWTWIGAERWAWPTHHYGRWGFHQARGFYWIPARKWGAAWVSWAVAPNYVGWCPLGWDGRPVFGFASFGSPHVIARGYDPWRGWTVVNSGRFGRGYDVHRHRVDHRVIVRERPAFVTAWGPPRRAGISGDVIVRGESRDGRGVAPPRHGYADRNVYGSRDGSSRRSGSGSRIGDPGIIVPRNNNAEPEESPYDRALRVMNRRGDSNQPNSGARQRDGSSNPGDGAPGRSGDAPSTSTIYPGGRQRSTSGNSYDGYGGSGAYPRHGGTVTRQPSTGGDGDSSPGVSRSPAQDDAPGISRPRYDGGGAVRRYGNSGDSNGNNDNNNGDRGDRGRRVGGDSDRGARYGDGGGRRSGGDSNDSGSNAGSTRERPSGPGPSGVSTPRHGGSSDGGGSSAGRSSGSSDRGDRGGSSAGRSSDGGGRSGGGRSEGGSSGAVRRNPR